MPSYRDHWFDRLRPYRAAGLLWETNILCPTDGNQNLWVLAPPSEFGSRSVSYRGSEAEIKSYFAICRNGHIHKL